MICAKRGCCNFFFRLQMLVLFSIPGLNSFLLEPPRFIEEPASTLEFSNIFGIRIKCKTDGNANISWSCSNNERSCTELLDLRTVEGDTLVLFPFSPGDFRAEIHSTTYRCMATNSFGTVVKDIFVEARIPKPVQPIVREAKGIRGFPVVLKCEFSGESFSTVSWMRDGLLINSNDKYLVVPESNVLVLWKLTSQDIYSEFECKVKEKFSKTEALSTGGKIELLNIDQIEYPPKIEQKIQKIIVDEQESVTIPCLALGNPKPIVQIYKKSSSGSLSLIQNSYDEAKYGARIFVRNDVLIITSAAKQDRGIYFCNATNRFGTDHMEVHLQVRYNPTLTLIPESTRVEFGKVAEFTCNSDDDETTDIIWLKDGNNLRLGDWRGRLKFLKHNKIQILRVIKEDQGIFQCIGKNQYSSQQKSAALWLGEARPTLIQSFIEQTVIQGEAISLKCKASGWPVPSFAWFLDGFDLPKSERFTTGQHLVDDTITSFVNISKVTNFDSGEYTCKASNKLGDVKHSNRMNVFGDLLIRPMQERIAMFGKSITMKCPVGGYPIDSIHWYKNEVKLPSNVNEKVSSNGILTIENVVKSASGTYQCTARRQNQVVHGYIKLLVVDLKINPKFHFGNPMVGERVTVICSVTTHLGNLRNVEINWLKDNETLTTGGNNLFGTTSNNVKITLIDTFTSSLTIYPLNKNNDGLYTCDITLKTPAASTSSSWTARLTITGDLPLTFKWFKDDVPLSTENHHLYDITRFGDNSEILTIKNITRDMSGVVTCRVSNPAETVSHSATLFVKAPPEMYVVPDDAQVVDGSSLKINCAARGSPHPRIKWLFQRGETGQFLEIDNGVRGVRNTDGVLTINRITKEHAGFYICQASNDVGPPINKRILVSVNVPPKITNMQDKIVTEIGKEVVFSCNYEGGQNLTVQWKHDGKDINHLLIEEMDLQNPEIYVSKIRIKSVSFSDRGEYACFVSNGHGHDYFVFSLIAQEQPHPVTLSPTLINSRSISLSWPIVDFVDITEFILSYRSKNENWKKLIVPGGQNQVRLDKLHPFTTYEFMLSSKNQIGTFKSSDTLIVTTSQEPPSFPKGLLIQPVSRPSELQISWLSPDFSNGIIKSYQIFYMREEDSVEKWKTVPGYVNYTIIRGVKPFSYYTIAIRANNAAGYGGNTTTKVLSPEDTPSYPPESVHCQGLSSQSIQALWQPPKPPHNGVILGYRVVLTLLENNTDKKSTEYESLVKGPATTIQGLQSLSNYGLQVSAFTKRGNGPVSNIYFCQTKESLPKEPSHISSFGTTVFWFYPRVSNDSLKYFHIYFRMHHDGHVTTIHKSIPAHKTFYELTDYIPNQTIEARVSVENIVGEGKPSRSVTFRTPSSHAQTGGIVSIGNFVIVPWKTTVSLPCEHTYSTKISLIWKRGNATLSKDRGNSLTIKNVLPQDTSNYSCIIQSMDSKDEITYTLVVQAPPKPPTLIVERRNNTIVLFWQAGDDGGSKILGFNLNYRQTNGEWEEKTLSKDDFQHEIVHNECFKRTYEIFVTSYNAIGMSETSKIEKVEIDGFFDFPRNLMDFISYNETTVTLNFTSWNFYECENGLLYTEYKISGSSYWIGVAVNSIGELVYLQKIDPEKQYTVKVRVQSKEKSELTHEFDVPFSLKAQGSNRNGTSTLTSYIGQQISIILPVLLALIFVISCVGGIVVYHARFRNKLRIKRTNSGSGSENENDFSAMREKYLRECNSSSKDIQPYATFSLKEHGVTRNANAHNTQLYTEEPGRFCESREVTYGVKKCRLSPQHDFEGGLIGKGSSRCDNYRLIQSPGSRIDRQHLGPLDVNEIYPTEWAGDYELSLIRGNNKSPLKYLHDNQNSRHKPSSPSYMQNFKYSQSQNYDYEPTNYASRIYEERPPSLPRNIRSKRRKSSSQSGQVAIDFTTINV